MTFHTRSIVEFGQLFKAVSGGAVSGQPISHSLELVRRQFNASHAALISERHGRTVETECVILGDEGEFLPDDGPSGALKLAELAGSCPHVSVQATMGDLPGRHTLWLFRGAESDGFTAEETAVAEMLVVQLTHGAEMARRMRFSEVERSLYSDVMERMSIGVVILDRNSKVLRASPIAERFLRECDGLQVQAGKLRAVAAREDKLLQAAIKAAAEDNPSDKGRGLSLTKRSGAKHLGVVVRPVGQAVALYVRDSEVVQGVESDLVRQILDLTPAEAGVARRLTEGLSLEDAAASLDISRNTARAHLRSIFSKSGITRQTELVRMVMNSAAMLGERPRLLA
jgi:DNA-binding CsgD family transcriptional regulator